MIGLRGSRGPLVLAVLGFLALAGSAFAAPKFPALTGRVVDEAHLLSPAANEKLTGELAQLETQTGHQLVVATIPSLQGYEIEDYGYQLGRTWGIGSKAQNDGVILLVAPAERKVRVEVGYGLEPVLTDALSSVIIQEKILPQFRAGHMEQGVVDGAEAIIAQLGLPEDQAKAIAQAPPQQARIRTQGTHIPGFVILFIIIWVVSALLRGRRGGGGGLWWLPLMFLGGGRDRSGWGGGGGGFGGGGGSFGGGGSSGGW
ncbi:YgcG family protein [Phenylobacterium aquaticum]|uniref:TPM domain-containing protein n=1 Tax=Phenylobacterium aquaticum TaxID=1763816 RepID=UPI0026EF0692|nr:TPM domain-containing protein [Phenylobacterium aquaticum]